MNQIKGSVIKELNEKIQNTKAEIFDAEQKLFYLKPYLEELETRLTNINKEC